MVRVLIGDSSLSLFDCIDLLRSTEDEGVNIHMCLCVCLFIYIYNIFSVLPHVLTFCSLYKPCVLLYCPFSKCFTYIDICLSKEKKVHMDVSYVGEVRY